MVSAAVAAIVDDPWVIESPAPLRRHYCAHDRVQMRGAVDRFGFEEHPTDPWPVEDGAYGLRWMEIMQDLRLHLRRSLAYQAPLGLPDRGADVIADWDNAPVVY